MTDQRPDPEILVKRAQEEASHEKRGKLKIYLGASPGVGKTYTMLQDALAKRAQGLDVVVGVAESHGREEIMALLKGLEILPRQKIDYRGTELEEFDLDAALKRNPALILIDEMAHTNPEGLRHTKRYQDIKEILYHGIDVYTTLNVQHIESLNDVVARITQIHIKETVPDSMLELADTIELVDLPPEDLLKRLQEGKIYLPEQVELAKENYFRKGNLIALRELALRETAAHVEAEILLYRQDQGIKQIWATKEKILVCVGSGMGSIKLIRAARRLATDMQANSLQKIEWFAVHVDTPRLQLSAEQHNNVIQNLRLAEQLGAHTRTLMNFDIVKGIMNFCHEQNITQIVVRKKIRSRWKDFLCHSLADEIIRHSGDTDVYLITGNIESNHLSKSALAVKPSFSWKMYITAITIVAGLLAFDFFFISPIHSFVLPNTQYLLILVLVFFIFQGIGFLIIRVRREMEALQRAVNYTAALHALSRQLVGARNLDELLEMGVRHIAKVFDSEVLVLLPENNHLVVWAQSNTETVQALNNKEQAIALWVYDRGQVAGLGTETLSVSEAIYVPMLVLHGAVGVLRVKPVKGNGLLTPEQMHLLEDCSNQIALALEVDRLQERSKKLELKTEADRVKSIFLQDISHSLRAPSDVVMHAANVLIEMGNHLDEHEIKKIGKDIYFELDQLSHLTDNILKMTYLEAESVRLEKELCSLSELLNPIIKISAKKLGSKPVHVHFPEDLPKVPVDVALIHQVFINLIDNAIKFTSDETPIEIYALAEKDKIVVNVENHGTGIGEDEVLKIFEKFFRGSKTTPKQGMGLGLTICRSIIKAHGGEIWAANRKDGGVAFCFTLPLI